MDDGGVSLPTHLLNWATLGKVCSAEGDSGRMSAQATTASPSFSTSDLWTTEQNTDHVFPFPLLDTERPAGCHQ